MIMPLSSFDLILAVDIAEELLAILDRAEEPLLGAQASLIVERLRDRQGALGISDRTLKTH